MFCVGLCRSIFLTGSACFGILLNVLSHVGPVNGALGSAKSGLSTDVPGVKSLKVICSQGTWYHYLFPFVWDTILQPQRFPKVPVLPGQCRHIFLLAAPSQGCMTQSSRIFAETVAETVAFAVVVSGLPELTSC